MKKTGELLRKAREEKGLSLNEIGLSLKISNKILKAIEDGDETNLPAKTFLRGFVKSYATFLRMDVDSVLNTFHEEMGSTKPQPYIRPLGSHETKSEEVVSQATATEESTRESAATTSTEAPSQNVADFPRAEKYAPLQENKSTRIIIISVVVIALFGLIVFTKKMIDKYSKEAEVPVVEMEKGIEAIPEENVEVDTDTLPTDTPRESTQGADSATPAASPISNLTSIVAPSAVAPISTPAPSPTPTPQPKVAATPTPAPTPAASPTPTPSPSPTPVASPNPTPTPSPIPTPTPSPTPADTTGKPVELIVEALDGVEIEYSAPNGKPQKIKLAADQVHTFKSKSGLKINFSNGGAVNLILNGRDVGIPGDLGKPIKLSY